jgi:hypothetical protein
MEANFSIEHEWKGMLVEAGYLGNFGRHLPLQNITYNINMIPPASLNPANDSRPLALKRPFTEFTGSNASVSVAGNNIVSDYNALTLKTQKRYSNGVSWIATFVWSKWLDDNITSSGTSTASDAPNYQNIYNLAGERAYSTANVPFRLVFSPMADLPFGKGKHWLNQGGVLNGIVGGWQGSMMMTLQNGSPLGPTVLNGGTNFLGDPNQTLRPNLVSGCNTKQNAWQPAANNIRGIQFLNSACFQVPGTNYTYGNQPRETYVRGPGVEQFNLQLSKSWVMKERYRVQFKAEAIDAFNTPQFAAPAETVNGSNFGIITGTDAATRRIMDFALKIFF